MNHNLAAQVAKCRAELAVLEARLTFVQTYLPTLADAVTDCKLTGDEPSISFDWKEKPLSQVLEGCPLGEEIHYLATHTGYPVGRTEAQSLRTVEAALPVHPAWLITSDILGVQANWMTTVGGLNLRVRVSVSSETVLREELWSGYLPVQNVKGLTTWRLPLETPVVGNLPSNVNPSEMLVEVAAYLSEVLRSEGAHRRGFAPPEVLEFLAQEKFNLPIQVTKRNYTWTGSVPDRIYGVALRDNEGRWWHELDKVRQVYRQGALDDTLWYEMVKFAVPETV